MMLVHFHSLASYIVRNHCAGRLIFGLLSCFRPCYKIVIISHMSDTVFNHLNLGVESTYTGKSLFYALVVLH